jgi:hypothetical protein
MLLGIQHNTNLLVYLLYYAPLYATESSTVIMVTTFNELYKGMPLSLTTILKSQHKSERKQRVHKAM